MNAFRLFAGIFLALGLSACGGNSNLAAPTETLGTSLGNESPEYRLGPGETIQVFVWRNPELSITVPIRPDGRFSMPLIEDLTAAGKTPSELSRDIEAQLAAYVQDPIVQVIAQVDGPGDPRQQIKVLGQATNPTSLSYRRGITALDVIIAVGGLTEFADGNSAVLVRKEGVEKVSYRLRLDDLVRKGDIAADRPLAPGDTIIIPETFL